MERIEDKKKFRIAFNLSTYSNRRLQIQVRQNHAIEPSLLECKPESLRAMGFTCDRIARLAKYRDTAEEELQRARERNIRLIFREQPEYPALLREIYDPPDYLYVLGDASTLQKKSLSVVGARKASRYGLAVLERILAPVVRAGLVITSGMAYGIDALAHKVALQNGGLTVGVNPGGLLNLYPRGNHRLLSTISRQGCIISEFPLRTVPRPFYFPVRNRIISGLSRALLVGEATRKSGSLITAGFALDQDRDVFAIPGRIDRPTSQGTNQLIQSGAKPILRARDILEEYQLQVPPPPLKAREPLSATEKKLLDLTASNGVKGIDYFVERSQLPVPVVISTLVELRLKGLVKEEQGGYIKIHEE